MAIIERDLPASNQWEIEATGKDIPKLSGMLNDTGNEAYRRAFHRDEGVGFERVSDPSGNPTWLRKDQVESALADGYGRVSGKLVFTVPDLPWKRRKMKPGRTRLRYDKATGQMVEVV